MVKNIKFLQMNSTYLRVWENCDEEWKYSKCFFQVTIFRGPMTIMSIMILTHIFGLQVQFLTPRAILPPPFRWFYYLARVIK